MLVLIRTLALIPARGGSKGLPGKNLALVAGRSLVARAVAVALAVPDVHDVVVSSDDDAILEEGRRAGASAERRPDHLASDTATTIEVVRHHLAHALEVERLVLLQPTSPLRSADDVQRCLDLVPSTAATTATVSTGHPVEWSFRMSATGVLTPLLGWPLPVRRQDAEPSWSLTGAVYVVTAAHLRSGGALVAPGTVGVPVPPERSVDVDDAVGLALARALAADHDPLDGT